MNRIKQFFNKLFQSPDIPAEAGLLYWRERILFLSMLAGVGLAVFAFIPSIVLLIEEKRWLLLSLAVASYITAILFMGMRHWRYEIRAIGTSIILYVMGLGIIIARGPFTGGPVWLFAFTASAAVYLGLRAALYALAVNTVTIVLLGVFIYSGNLSWELRMTDPLGNWAVAGIMFVVVNAIFSIAIAALVQGLESSLIKEKSTTNALEREIEERITAEKALRESEGKYQTLLEDIEEGYYEVDIKGNFTFFNDSLGKILGYPKAEMMGENYRQFVVQEHIQIVYDTFNKVYKTGKPAKLVEHCFVRKDGSKGYADLSVSLIRDLKSSPVGFRGNIRDVTKRKLAEEERQKLLEQLQHAQRMESLGTLTSGVAHNFRNILEGISVNNQLIQMKYNTDPQLMEITSRTGNSVKKGTQLIEGLMRFSRKQVMKTFKTVDLSGILRETYQIVSDSFDRKIDITTEIPNSLFINGSYADLNQVVMNLCTNARDAMPEGGTLRIEAMEEGDRALVIISDTGFGMDPETRESCFDPFFTTKDVDKGTGLGLYTVYGIVKEHGGEIHVVSEPNKGTTFNLYFPLAVMQQDLQEEDTASIKRGDGQKILIVDDEMELFTSLENLLSELGYRVNSVDSGKAAISKYRTWHPDVVLLDRNMPEMDGIACAQKLIDLDTEAKIVLVSGYEETGPQGINDNIKSIIKGYLTKPIDMALLSGLLDELIRN